MKSYLRSKLKTCVLMENHEGRCKARCGSRSKGRGKASENDREIHT